MTTLFLTRSALALALLLPATVPAFVQAATATHPLDLTAAEAKTAGIVTAKAGLRQVADELKAPGEVKADAYSTVLVSPRIESQVLARKARLGDVVQSGDPLVLLSSVEVATTQGALIVAEQDWQRIASLGPQAVSARRYNEARVARDQARAKLRAYGLSDAQIRGLLRAGSAKADGSYALLAPVAGRVTTDDFLVGERVQAGRTLFTLVKEDSVWVVAQMSPEDAEKVSSGDAARIVAHDVSLPGTVIQRSHQTNERTRTVPVRIEVANPRDLLHAGELVEARVSVGKRSQVLAVPTAAVVRLQNQPTVFVVKGQGQFAPAAIVTGDTREGWVEVRQGLKPGTEYVRQGAFALKARLLRSQLGEE
jgi:cobalt-zinc-cadmium efflux system membrane fusion protein